MKIGYIAMSGVRCQNAELMALGLTLPGFVERSEVIASLPSLGLLTLAGLTPRHHDIRYLEVADIHALDGVPVWAGLLADAEHGRLRPRYDARRTPFNLANAPLPRFDLLDPSRYNRYTVQTQRGCVFDCEFCAASIRLAPGFKTKPVDKVIAEIRAVKQHAAHGFIEFADDNTFADKRRGKALMRAMQGLGARWFTETDVSVADDPELLDLMRDAGCAQILIGFESPQAAPLRGLERKADWKARRHDRYMEAIQGIQDRGITVNGCFVLGLDGSDESAFDAVESFVRESALFEVQITVLTPFPGTPLYARLEAEGRLTQPGQWDRSTLFDVNFRPQNMTVEALERGFRELGSRLYNEDATHERRERFWQRMRAARRERVSA